VIRVVTLDEFDPALLKQLCKALFAAFGVGTDASGPTTVPASLHEPFDANKLLEVLPKSDALPDDKVLYLTTRKLSPRKLISGEAPTAGLSRYGGQRAIITVAHIKNPVENVRAVARQAMQELGHTFGLHHCLDARCAMHPPWVPSYAAADATFCGFCRDQVDQKIRQAKS
jgi:archaemetzincin